MCLSKYNKLQFIIDRVLAILSAIGLKFLFYASAHV